ncbi:MAG: VWA domain-containing protein [Phycisphaerales bacterium]|nr:MAG: VWA domain-containing protein [Phycisphaerales bacterium]
MDALAFDHPKMLYVLWALPVLWSLYVWGFAKKREALQRFVTANLLPTLIPSVSVMRQQVKAALIVAAAAVLVLATAGPRWGSRYEHVPVRAIDVMVVLDVSNSMLCEDVVPNRLQRGMLDIEDMLRVLPGDRIGLVTFAGTSTLTCPLTVNYGAFRMALGAVNTRSTPRGGTNVGDAVRRAVDSFPEKVSDHRAIIVISDGGETDESYAVEASLKAFEEKGIRVFTVGIGDMTEGARIPIKRDGRPAYMMHQGKEIWTRLEPTLLQSMAAAGHGAYFANPDFRRVSAGIRSGLTPRELEATRRRTQNVRFHWPASLALALLVIETLMTDRKAVTA